MKQWLRKLFGSREEIPATVHIDPQRLRVRVSIEPDPDMAPGKWSWSCYGCEAGGEGESQQMRAEAMTHALLTGHTTHGDAIDEQGR